VNFWLLLALPGLLALVAAAAFAGIRFVRLLRDADAAGGALGESLERIAAGADRAAGRAEGLAPAGARLERALARLAVSRARLDVLLHAYADARAALASLVFIPRK
jgi:hypothetical protein